MNLDVVQARLIGGLRIVARDGRDLTPRSRKAAAIIGYLLLSGGPTARRERVASLLWSEKAEVQARDSLRQCLVELRRLPLAGVALAIGPREIGLATSAIATDVSALQSALRRGDPAAATAHLAGDDLDLLAGHDDLDPAFADWLAVERERWSQTVVAELLRVIRRGSDTREDLLALTDAILRLDPYQEEAVQITMENLASDGSPSAALALFERYTRSLGRAYDVAPSGQLAAFAGRLRTARDSPLAAVRPANAPQPRAAVLQNVPPRIAVVVAGLPGGNSELDYLADAFRHDLIATLSRFKEWTIVVPPHSEEARPRAEDQAFLAAQGIDYELRGVLRASEDTLIDVTLSDCDTGHRLLDEHFTVKSGRWIAVLNDICRKVGARQQIAISTARLRSVAGRTADQQSAYDLWLQGQHLTTLWRKDADDRAQALFERALELDPSLARAYSSLAAILHTRHIVCPGWPQVMEDRQKALALARKAVELDRMDCRNHVILGWAHALALRFDSADFHFRLAVDLNPSNPDTAISAADAAVLSGDHDAALELARRAFELNSVPSSFYFGYRAHVAFFCGDYHGCIEDVAQAGSIFPAIRMWSTMALARLGDAGAAVTELNACLAELRASWFGPCPDAAALLNYLGSVWRFRRKEDQRLVIETLAAIAGRQALGRQWPRPSGSSSGCSRPR